LESQNKRRVWILWGRTALRPERALLGVFDAVEQAKEAANKHSRLKQELSWLEDAELTAHYANHPEPFDYIIVQVPANELL